MQTHIPLQLAVANVDISFISRAFHELVERIQHLEAKTEDLKAENTELSTRLADVSHQVLVSQDQYSSLYDTVHTGMAKLNQLQLSAYERTQAASEFSLVNREIQLLKDETARLCVAKLDCNSSELDMQVQQTATESTMRVIQKFERDNKEWTAHFVSSMEDKLQKSQAQKIVELENSIDGRVLPLQHSLEDVLHKDSTLRKDLETNYNSLVSLVRVLTGKLDTHEKQLDQAEDEIFARVDLVRQRFDVFLEHCIGISWSTLIASIDAGNPLVSSDLRKQLFEPLSDDVCRRGATRVRRQMENIREWKRLFALNPRVLVGLADLLRKVDAGEETFEATSMARINQRKAEEYSQECRRNQDVQAHHRLLAEFLAHASADDLGLGAPAAVEPLKAMLSTPLLAHLRGSQSREVSHSLALAQEQFGQEYSNQLALVMSELRQKATLSGLEETVREFASRTMAKELQSMQTAVATIQSLYVSEPALMDLLRSKADVLALERKAEALSLQSVEQSLRSEIQDLRSKVTADVYSMALARITDMSRQIAANASKASELLSEQQQHSHELHSNTATSSATPAVGGSSPPLTVIGQDGTSRCLSCRQPLSVVRVTRDGDDRDARLQAAQDDIHNEQMKHGAGTVVENGDDTGTGGGMVAAGDSDVTVVLPIALSAAPVHSKRTTGQKTGSDVVGLSKNPFSVKEWADDVDRRFGKEKDAKKPRPPSGKR